MSFDQIVTDIGQVIDAAGVAGRIVAGVLVATLVATVCSRNHDHGMYTVFRRWPSDHPLVARHPGAADSVRRTAVGAQ